MTLMSAPTAARSAEVQRRLFDRNYTRSPGQLSDGLILDIARAVRRDKPNISDDELEAVFAGFEKIGRNAAVRSRQSREVETEIMPQAALAHRLVAVDEAVRDVMSTPGATARAAAGARLSELISGMGNELRPHGLSSTWRADFMDKPEELLAVVQAAEKSAGVQVQRLADARQQHREQQRLTIGSEAAALWSETYTAADHSSAEPFNEFAEQAVAALAGDELDG